jgi:SAM-dependent methyltransferase
MFSVEALQRIRDWELQRIVTHFRSGARILEVGAGTGQQSLELARRGFSVEAIELSTSEYTDVRIFPVVNYDGETIPFPDHSFDVVFSSNVLEHIPNLTRIHSEIIRVLKEDGCIIHVLPTHAWRFWSNLSAFPAALQHIRAIRNHMVPRQPFTSAELHRLRQVWGIVGERLLWAVVQHRHGVRGNAISEIWLFRPGFWRKNFRRNGLTIIHEEPIGLFYTGHMVLDRRLSIGARARMAKVLGSACHCFVLKPQSPVPRWA